MAVSTWTAHVALCLLLSHTVNMETTLTLSGSVEELQTGIPEPTPPSEPCRCPYLCKTSDGNSHHGNSFQIETKATDKASPTCFPSNDVTTQAANQSNTQQPQWLTDLFLQAVLAAWSFTVIVYPIIGILGLVGNLFSFLILVRSGFDKPSNIFLLGLTVADSLCLLGAVNICTIIRYTPRNLPFAVWLWDSPRDSSFVCFIFATSFQCLSFYGIYVSAGLCVAITVERLIAVYLPLHFTNIITPKRAWLVCCTIFLVWLPYLVFAGISWYTFNYTYYPVWNVVGGDMVFGRSNIIDTLDLYVASVFGKFIPLAIVISGSVLIAIKVTITMRRRQKMVSSSSKKASSGSRTTTTLLMVCAVFTFTKIFTFCTYFVNSYNTYTNIIGIYLGSLVMSFEYINSSCNFLIYMLFNTKFRLVLLDILCRKGPSN